MVGGEDAGLRRALDRLSTSLERVEALLEALYAAQNSSQSNPGAHHQHSTALSQDTRMADTGSEPAPRPDPASGRPDEPRVIYGGGPSAFATRVRRAPHAAR